MEDCEAVCMRKLDAAPKKGISSYRDTLTSVMSKWYATCIILRLENEKEPEGWEQLHVGVDGLICQFQVLMTQLPQKCWSGKRTER